MDSRDELDLKKAVQLLEHPGLGARIGDVIGMPVEKAIAMLPNRASDAIGNAAQKSISGALKLALKTMPKARHADAAEAPGAANWWHTAATATSGAVGGFFGAAAILLELPVSTTIIMRSIADVARSQGADLDDVTTQLECVQVLAFGGPTSKDSNADIGYFMAREALARAVKEAAAHIAKHGLKSQGAPALVRLISGIAARYSVVITEKLAAQAVPVIGAVGGAVINTIFIDHYQNMATGHFTVRRLEKKYGADMVRSRYAELKALGE